LRIKVCSIEQTEKCKGSRASPEIKQQILKFHRTAREDKPIEWDCKLEQIARSTTKDATTRINAEKVNKKRGLNFFEYDEEDRKQFTKAGDIVKFVLDYWWSSERYARCIMDDKNIMKLGCSYKDDKVFLFDCVYKK
ncbi:hypothetical protein ANCCAN_12249, partial [Ancylostoma caninum]